MSDTYDHLILPENDNLAISQSRMCSNQSPEEGPTTQPEVLDEILIFIYCMNELCLGAYIYHNGCRSASLRSHPPFGRSHR